MIGDSSSKISREASLSMNNLEKLEVWCRAKEFAIQIYREIIPLLPPEEKWAMAQQIRRSACSIPANLAEGHGRYYYQETIRFSYIARGSLEETYNYLVLAHEMGYIKDEKYREIVALGEKLVRLINGYIAYLKNARVGSNEPGNPLIREALADYFVNDGTEFPE